ncbi:hypothetical protein COLO4_32985 [Corchorus olitorius]|uniref:Uncharacterized protein n=1 Tax=Corchorus olitorius TaxID=93759 RepID=A0A1R3GXA2_9ROSI|nr:hypothetical protein COLO4_32985 [Corchorus olitorius]
MMSSYFHSILANMCSFFCVTIVDYLVLMPDALLVASTIIYGFQWVGLDVFLINQSSMTGSIIFLRSQTEPSVYNVIHFSNSLSPFPFYFRRLIIWPVSVYNLWHLLWLSHYLVGNHTIL